MTATVPTTVRLPPALLSRVRASGLTLPDLISRGLGCAGHHGDPPGELRSRLEAAEDRLEAAEDRLEAAERQLAARQPGRPPPGRAGHWAGAVAGQEVTAAAAAAIWDTGVRTAQRRLAVLAGAGLARVLPPGAGHGSPARRYEIAPELPELLDV